MGSSSLRFLDYGTRMYDPTTVRWLTQDPMAEKYYGYSPYNYCVGNPVLYVDEEGNEIVISAIIAAAVVSAVIDVVEQIALNAVMGQQPTSIDICSVLTSAVTGAIGAGAANVIKYMAKFGKVARFGGKTLEGLIEGASEYLLKLTSNDEEFSSDDLLLSVCYNSSFNILGQMRRAIKRSGAEMKNLLREADHAFRLSKGNNARLSRKNKTESLINQIDVYGEDAEKKYEQVGDFFQIISSKADEKGEKEDE